MFRGPWRAPGSAQCCSTQRGACRAGTPPAHAQESQPPAWDSRRAPRLSRRARPPHGPSGAQPPAHLGRARGPGPDRASDRQLPRDTPGPCHQAARHPRPVRPPAIWITLGDPEPKLERRQGGHGDRGTFRQSTRQPLAHPRRSPVEQRDIDVGVEQIAAATAHPRSTSSPSGTSG